MHKNRAGNFVGQKRTKRAKRTRFQAKTAEVGCVSGAGEGCSGWRRMKPGEKTRKARRKSRDGLVSAAASVGAGRSPQATSAPRHAPQESLRAHLVAKSYRTLTKKSGTAEAIPDFFGRGRRTRTLGTRFWSGCGKKAGKEKMAEQRGLSGRGRRLRC